MVKQPTRCCSWLNKRKGEGIMLRDPHEMAEIQRDNPGLWVAVKNGEVVAAWEHPYGLYMKLEEQGIVDATVFRCPRHDEPELVGLG